MTVSMGMLILVSTIKGAVIVMTVSKEMLILVSTILRELLLLSITMSMGMLILVSTIQRAVIVEYDREYGNANICWTSLCTGEG